MLDLVENGSNWDEIVQLAKALETSGVNIINTGIGWHETRIPTIATMVPRAAFSWVTEKLRAEVTLPLVATNRINTPEIAEQILISGQADMISMARPFLADAEFVNKAQHGKAQLINTCIACNQACLDHIFQRKIASCLVNPKACHETEFSHKKPAVIKRIAVIGAGPAGLSFALQAAQLGHDIVIFEKHSELGGQFNIAKNIPGKEEFSESLRYFSQAIKQHKIDCRFNTIAKLQDLQQGFDEIVVATGVNPRKIDIPGIDSNRVLAYPDVLYSKQPVGKAVAIIGAGGIGFDAAEYLAHHTHDENEMPDKSEYYSSWGIDINYHQRGAICTPQQAQPVRQIYMLQRKTSKPGNALGKTTGWIHRLSLRKLKVEMISGVHYEKIDEMGLHIVVNEQARILEVDNIVVCAGQVSENKLYQELLARGLKPHLIGGAQLAQEIDAKKAINAGVRLAHQI